MSKLHCWFLDSIEISSATLLNLSIFFIPTTGIPNPFCLSPIYGLHSYVVCALFAATCIGGGNFCNCGFR